MPDQAPRYVAAIYCRDRTSIAGTGFAIREGYLVTCAHVVRDALGLGKPTPEARPVEAVMVKFLCLEGHPAVSAIVAPGGWFPGDSGNVGIGPLKDIAILMPEDGARAFPTGPQLLAGGWHADASFFGFPSARGGRYRLIKGSIQDIPQTDRWLNFAPAEPLEKAELGGMSGSPVRRDWVEAIGGMFSGDWSDDERIFRIVPGAALDEAVAQAKQHAAAGEASAALHRADSRDRSASAALAEWQAASTSPLPPSPEDIGALCQILLDAARLKANLLPESFPFRYLERRLGRLRKLSEGDWPPETEKTGESIATLAAFLAVLAASDHEMSAAIDACGAAGRSLGALLAQSPEPRAVPCWSASDARWPDGAAAEVRRQTEALQATAAALNAEPEFHAGADDIGEHAENIHIETDRDPPDWALMAVSSAEIVKASDALKQVGAFPGLSAAATGLKQSLCRASHAAIAALKPLQRFKELPFAPEMVVIPAGRFLMGSPEEESDRFNDEGPRHEVTIPRPFAVGRYPITRGQFAAFVDATGHKTEGGAHVLDGKDWTHDPSKSWRDPGFAQDDQHPVVCVNWDDARAYASWLNNVTGGKHYRLLSEAEWEYCCRAGSETRFFFGDEIREDQARFNADGTVAVGSYSPNRFGLFDMHGNVWEWVEDGWHESYADKPEVLKATGGVWTTEGSSPHVLRGGSWYNDPYWLRAAYRDRLSSDDRYNDGGFRLASTLPTAGAFVPSRDRARAAPVTAVAGARGSVQGHS